MKDCARKLTYVATVALAACASTDGYIVRNPNVGVMLGAQYRVCSSKIRFQQTEFTVENLAGPSQSAGESKSFQVGKIGITAAQAQQISTIALALDSLQTQMCTTTQDLKVRGGDAYDKYVVERDARLERVITALTKADASIKAGVPQDNVIADLTASIQK